MLNLITDKEYKESEFYKKEQAQIVPIRWH